MAQPEVVGVKITKRNTRKTLPEGVKIVATRSSVVFGANRVTDRNGAIGNARDMGIREWRRQFGEIPWGNAEEIIMHSDLNVSYELRVYPEGV